MRCECQWSNMQYLLIQHEVVEHVVKEDVEQRVATAASRVVIGLNGHEATEQGIEYIQHRKDGLAYVVVNVSHGIAEGRRAPVFKRQAFR